MTRNPARGLERTWRTTLDEVKAVDIIIMMIESMADWKCEEKEITGAKIMGVESEGRDLSVLIRVPNEEVGYRNLWIDRLRVYPDEIIAPQAHPLKEVAIPMGSPYVGETIRKRLVKTATQRYGNLSRIWSTHPRADNETWTIKEKQYILDKLKECIEQAKQWTT